MRSLVATLLIAASPASAQDVKQLLGRGPLVLVETDDGGRFKQATAVAHVNRPPEEVWRIIGNFAHFKTFMPKMLKSEARGVAKNEVDVDFELDTPGANLHYTLRFEIDPGKHTASGRWVKGDLKQSTCTWRVAPFGKSGSLVYYETSLRNFSPLAESLEDEQQTVTVGLNVTAALAAVKAMKEHAENGPSASAR